MPLGLPRRKEPKIDCRWDGVVGSVVKGNPKPSMVVVVAVAAEDEEMMVEDTEEE